MKKNSSGKLERLYFIDKFKCKKKKNIWLLSWNKEIK